MPPSGVKASERAEAGIRTVSHRLKSRYSTKGVGIATVERISKRKNGMSIKVPLTAVTNGSIDMGSTEIIGASERALADLRGDRKSVV